MPYNCDRGGSAGAMERKAKGPGCVRADYKRPHGRSPEAFAGKEISPRKKIKKNLEV